MSICVVEELVLFSSCLPDLTTSNYPSTVIPLKLPAFLRHSGNYVSAFVTNVDILRLLLLMLRDY